MNEKTFIIHCRKCRLSLAIERDGLLYVGQKAFDTPVDLKCRICARLTEWQPPKRREAKPIDDRANFWGGGYWGREAV
jgi:hypothetical protein